MRLEFRCPRCERTSAVSVAAQSESVACPHCNWIRELGREHIDHNRPSECLVCGCGDLWRQKDFPQRVGLTLVGLGIVLSSIAWAYVRPVLAIGILMAFALADLVLYAWMRDALVCYRCGAKYRDATLDERDSHFDHETAERYRQEAIRLRGS
jgi:hypothetical protein